MLCLSGFELYSLGCPCFQLAWLASKAFLANLVYRRTAINPIRKKKMGLVKMALRLVHASRNSMSE